MKTEIAGGRSVLVVGAVASWGW